MPRAKDWQALDAEKRENVGQLLLKCARLLDERALARINAAGPGLELRPSHTRLLPHIDREGTRLVELARRLGVTKQAVGQLVAELERLGALELVPDPADGRAKLVRFTARGLGAIRHGLGVLRELETELERRIGRAHMSALRRALPELLRALEEGAGGGDAEPA
jgi:DNA-binding MarR family transcriptional regulator